MNPSMRRLVSSCLAGLAVLAATVGWSSVAATATVLDPAHTDRVAEVLAGDAAVRAAVEVALAQALVAAVPAGAPVSIDELQAAARRAVDDPRVVAVVRAAIVDAHRRVLGEGDGTVRVDAGPIAAAGRDAVLATRPELAGILPAPPPLTVDLPTDSLPDLGWVRRAASGATRPAAQAASGLFAAALLVAADRPRVLRRAGLFALWAGVGWFALGWLVPWAVSHWSVDGRLGVLGSLAAATARPMMAPAAALLAAGGVVLLAASAGAKWRTARRPVAVPGPAPGGPVWHPVTVAPPAPPAAVPLSHPAIKITKKPGPGN